jgi:hypothetical protein
MNQHSKRLSLLTAFVFIGLVEGGCASMVETFSGHDADEVWTAMMAVARTPDYSAADPADRWTVRENHVWVDESNRRIEIFRRLERDLYQPAARHRHQQRQWKMQAALEERDPPTVRFRARQASVPAHVWEEAERYFDEVREVLEGGLPGESEARPPAPPAAPVIEVQPPQTQPAQEQPIDIEELEPEQP